MNRRFVAKQAVVINAPSRKVWDALVNPEIARQYMFGTNAITDWKKSRPVAVKEEVKGKTYNDKGALLEVEPERLIKYNFYSPQIFFLPIQKPPLPVCAAPQQAHHAAI